MNEALLAVVAIGAALVNWWSRLDERRRLAERCTKPLVSGCVLGIAMVVEPRYEATQAWFVAGFALCLLGDVLLMLPAEQFLAGLAAFAAAHVCFMLGMLAGTDLPGAGSKVLVIGTVVVLLVVVAPRVIAGASQRAPALAVATGAYVAIIAAMAIVAAVRGTDRAAAGAVCFVISDSLLGWSRFVARFRWDRVSVMVFYHLALAGLVSSLWP